MPSNYALANRPSHAIATEQRSPHNRLLALVLCIFLGTIGIHRFYLGRWITGLLWLATGGLFGIGWIYDIVMIAIGRMQDGEGRVLGPPQYEMRREMRHMTYDAPSAPPPPARRQKQRRKPDELELQPVRGEAGRGEDGEVGEVGEVGFDDELMRDPLEDKFAELEREMNGSKK